MRQLRDRFERQEFLAIMVPAMMPPPMPVKLIEFAAGVFEMKPLWFFSAIFLGKFVRFLLEAMITIVYGPTILQTIGRVRAAASWLCAWRSLGFWPGCWSFMWSASCSARRRGTRFPVEDEPAK